MVDSFGCSFFESEEKGMHRRNIRLSENYSLLTAVAMLDSISMIWNLVALLTDEKISNISLLARARGTFSLTEGK